MNLFIYRWRNWGIRDRLVFIAVFPVLSLFTIVVLHSFQSRIADSQQELTENSQIIAAALASSSEYGVVSANYADIELLINGLIKADRSIVQIEILDADRKALLVETAESSRSASNFSVDAPIRKTNLPFNVFDEHGAPQITDLADSTPTIAQPPTSENVIGYVRVTMSKANMLDRQNKWLLTQFKILLLALLGCILITIFLARSLTKPLESSIKALNQIKSGVSDVKIPVTTGGEIGSLQESINAMSLSLAQAREDLERKICERTSALQVSRNAAVKSDAEKRQLIQKVNSIVEEERKSIAIEIHDELNSSLIAARLHSERILAIAARMNATEDVKEIQEKGDAIVELIRHLYVSSRKIVRQLRPEVLDMLGLSGAIEEIVRQYNSSQASCLFEFSSYGDFSSLDSNVSIAAYRIVQEALSNIVKHAKATSVSAFLTLNKEFNVIDIVVKDNGIGFNTSSAPGMGIVGMRERVFALGGKISITSSAQAGEGATYAITIPLGPGVFVDRRTTSRRT